MPYISSKIPNTQPGTISFIGRFIEDDAEAVSGWFTSCANYDQAQVAQSVSYISTTFKTSNSGNLAAEDEGSRCLDSHDSIIFINITVLANVHMIFLANLPAHMLQELHTPCQIVSVLCACR